MRDLNGGFTPDQMRRYSRHILLPDLGGRGQSRLLAATASVSADGAAARIAAAYLAAAGVGTIVLTGNLERPVTSLQYPLARPDLGQPLGPALVARLSLLNPDAHIHAGDRFRGSNYPKLHTNDSSHLDPRNLSPAGIRTGSRTELTVEMAIDGDADEMPLAEAMARGGEAAARMVWQLAVGAP